MVGHEIVVHNGPLGASLRAWLAHPSSRACRSLRLGQQASLTADDARQLAGSAAGRSLVALALGEVRTTPDGLDAILSMPTLAELTIGGGSSIDGASGYEMSWPTLEREHVAVLVGSPHRAKLRRLSVRNEPAVEPAEVIAALPGLETLTVDYVPMPTAGGERIVLPDAGRRKPMPRPPADPPAELREVRAVLVRRRRALFELDPTGPARTVYGYAEEIRLLQDRIDALDRAEDDERGYGCASTSSTEADMDRIATKFVEHLRRVRQDLVAERRALLDTWRGYDADYKSRLFAEQVQHIQDLIAAVDRAEEDELSNPDGVRAPR